MREISTNRYCCSGSAAVVLSVFVAWELRLGDRQSRLPKLIVSESSLHVHEAQGNQCRRGRKCACRDVATTLRHGRDGLQPGGQGVGKVDHPVRGAGTV